MGICQSRITIYLKSLLWNSCKLYFYIASIHDWGRTYCACDFAKIVPHILVGHKRHPKLALAYGFLAALKTIVPAAANNEPVGAFFPPNVHIKHRKIAVKNGAAYAVGFEIFGDFLRVGIYFFAVRNVVRGAQRNPPFAWRKMQQCMKDPRMSLDVNS